MTIAKTIPNYTHISTLGVENPAAFGPATGSLRQVGSGSIGCLSKSLGHGVLPNLIITCIYIYIYSVCCCV